MDTNPLRSAPSFRILSIILVFIFAGAIVGETVALSIVVSIAGSEILSKLYLINGFLLFLLPPLFFHYIDRANRAKLLAFLLLFSSCSLIGILVLFKIGVQISAPSARALLWIIYPLSYLSKTVLFLTFWTLANDVCFRGEAKKAFPKVASWGFVGGLGGAWIARVLLEVVEAETIIIMWAGAYFVAFVFTLQARRLFRLRLLRKERVPDKAPRQIGTVFEEVKDVLAIDLVRLISILYFLVFLAVFSLDFLFWHMCHLWFTTVHQLAAFQFSFYIAHSVVTIAALRFAMPVLIGKWGFPRIFSFLPFVLLGGAFMLLGLSLLPLDTRVVFIALIILQFARYITFENAFSPIYQMFFASISKDKRGRAKTILEGMIKPSAIIAAGAVVILLGRYMHGVMYAILAVSAVMVWVVGRVRLTYTKGLIPELSSAEEPSNIIEEIGSHYDLKILSLIKEYSRSEDADLRAVAVKILAHLGSREALSIVAEIYRREKQESVKEMVARSLTNFYWYEAKGLVEALLHDRNPRIRSNALYSLNEMNCHWKWRLKDTVKALLFDKSIRVQIEAARYMWQTNDSSERHAVAAFLASQLESKNTNKRSAGLYLVGQLKPDNWEQLLINNLTSGSFQIYAMCIDVIFLSAQKSAQLKTLRIVQTLSREHIAALGRVIQKRGWGAQQTICAFLREAQSRRILFELVHAMRIILDANSSSRSGRERFLDKPAEEALSKWILSELNKAYRDSAVWHALRQKAAGNGSDIWMHILDDALRERLARIAEWALDTLIVLERQRGIGWSKQDLDINDYSDRMDIIEVLENYGSSRLSALIVPILQNDSWEKISRIGRQYFSLNDDVERSGLEYFVRSENKWLSLCALYGVFCSPHRNEILKNERSTLEGQIHDTYEYLARAAQRLLNITRDNESAMRNTFELLETVLFFKKTLLFRNVPAEKLMGLAEISQLVSYEKDTVVSREGDISDHLYVVKSGSLKIVKVKNNVRTILSIIRQGEAYGEIGLLNQAPRSATAVANENCEIYVVQRKSLKKLLMEMPEIAYNFLEIFSEKLRRSGEEVALLQTTLSGRIKQEANIGNT